MLSPSEWEIVGLSLRVAGLAVLLGLGPGLLLAYGLARRRVPLPFLVENLVQLPLVLPPVVVGYLLLLLFAPRGPVGQALASLGLPVAFTTAGAALAAGVVAFPFLVQTMRVTFEALDSEWEEAASVDGATRGQVFRWVTLPLAARGVLAAVVLAFARALGEFGATIVLAGNIPGETRTLPLAIFTDLNRLGGEVSALRLVLFSIALSVLALSAHALLTRRLFRF